LCLRLAATRHPPPPVKQIDQDQLFSAVAFTRREEKYVMTFKHHTRMLRLFNLLLATVLFGVLGLPSVPLSPVRAAPNGWTATGSMANARYAHTVTLLPDGRVLAAGGFGSGSALRCAEVYDPATGAWSSTGDLNAARHYHTATLLPDGRVLVAGGRGSSGVLSSAELYDPATGVWTTTAAMHAARYWHTATLLPDGRVLVAGGRGSDGPISSAEVYDPATETWSPTGGLSAVRYLHTATLLPAGKVLVAAGWSDGGTLRSAEVYDPATGAWTATGKLRTSRYYHTATLLPDGQVLVAGGYGMVGPLVDAEVYDPATGNWSFTGDLGRKRYWHTATLLPNGRVLVAGGDGGSCLDSAEVYDPATGAWATTGELNTARYGHSAVLLPGGDLLVTGGLDNGDPLDSVEVYDPAAGAWSPTGGLSTPRMEHTATMLPAGRVLVAGGSGGTDALDSAAVYDPATGTWSPTGGLNTARNAHSATLLLDDRVLVAGGEDGDGEPRGAEVYNPTTGVWTVTGDLNYGRSDHTATLLRSGKVLVVGGYGNGGLLRTAELYDPATGSWSRTGDLDHARSRHTATLLPDGRVLVAGGHDSAAAVGSAEIYDPTTGAWTETDDLHTARYGHTATLLPGGRVLVTAGFAGPGLYLASVELYDPATGVWSAAASLTTARGGQTATLLPDGHVLVVGGFNLSAGGSLSSAEVYDPATDNWSTTTSLSTARDSHTATLLPDSKILIAAGYNYDSGSSLGSAELYDAVLTYSTLSGPARPTLNAVTAPLVLGSRLNLTGAGFCDRAESSGGSWSSSPTNYPLVQLRALESDQVRWLLPDPATPFSDSAFTSLPVTDLAPGNAWVTVFVNGIPSLSRLTSIQSPDLIVDKAVTPALARPGRAITYTLAFANAGHATAAGVVITDRLPPELSGPSYRASAGIAITPTGTLSYAWQVSDLAPGHSAAITVTGLLITGLPAGTQINNTALIAAAVPEANVADNWDSAALTVLNVRPSAHGDSGPGFVTTEDASFTTGDVLANDSDLNGDSLFVQGYDASGTLGLVDYGASDGTFAYDPDGQFDYLAAGEQALDTFTYVVSDGTLTDVATVTITVNGVNDPPQAFDDHYATAEGAPLTVPAATGVLANDLDAEDDPLTALLDSSPSNGDLAFAADGSFVYTPTAGFTGVDTFTYRAHDGLANSNVATVSVIVGDEIPPQVTAVSPPDRATGVAVDAPVVITFSETIDPASLAYTVVPNPRGWSVTWNGDGTVATLRHAPFGYWADYAVTVTGAEDVSGNPLAAVYHWSFTTTPVQVYLPLLLR
jgi:uncharacterized repeat protein (TIGR01451 family)